MPKVDIWERAMPPLPFSLHVYRESKDSYMVYPSTTVCGDTVRSEPITFDLAMRLVSEFGMAAAQPSESRT